MAYPLQDPQLVREYINQQDAWASAQGYLPITQMTPTHALASAVYLLDHARSICLALAITDAEGVLQPRPNEEIRSRIAQEVPARYYIMGTPLFKALCRRAAARPEEAKPWEQVLAEPSGGKPGVVFYGTTDSTGRRIPARDEHGRLATRTFPVGRDWPNFPGAGLSDDDGAW